jgi:UDP-glucuronate decarboxylase
MAVILVTGGAGFIGSHLCEYLLERGNEVICVDNYFTGSKRNISHLLDDHNFEAIRHDLVNPLYLEVDQIYNLACPASPIQYSRNPVKTIKMNTVAMVNMLGLAKRTDARILQASSSEVYGDPQMHPQREDYWGHVNPIGPRSCYDEGKRVAESLMFAYHSQSEMEIRIARIFNTYGPRMAMDDGRVISNFVVQALRNEDLSIYGNGMQSRSFCYVSDMVEGLHRLMNSDLVGPVNLGNPIETSIDSLADSIIRISSSGSRKCYLPLPQDDPVRRNPDISLARERLGWEPGVPLEKGLKDTVEYFQSIV